MSEREDLSGIGGYDGTSDLVVRTTSSGVEIGRRGGGGGRGGGGRGGRGGRGGFHRGRHRGGRGGFFGPFVYDGYPYYDPFNRPVMLLDEDEELIYEPVMQVKSRRR